MLLLGTGGVQAASASTAGTVSAASAPSGDSGTTIDPLVYNCGNDAPTCGQVGESYGYYNGQNVDLLYTENYYCDPSVMSHASTGCEAGSPGSANPTGTSADGTTLGNTTSSDTLYIPVPLFKNAPPTQCVATATCIDHPQTIDLSALAGALGVSDPSTLYNVPIPAHNHVVGTRNNGLPEWWNVQVVADFDPAVFSGLTSVSAIQAAEKSEPKSVVPVATNVWLMFQVMPGTVPATQAANLNAYAPSGPAVPAAPNPDPKVSQAEPGVTYDNLVNDCTGGGPNCENVGISHDWISGTDVDALYTEPYFCDNTVSSGASTGCEAGAPPNKVPPGVADQTAPTPTVSNQNIDPLYIPVPLFSTPAPYTQCPSVIMCVDHPATIDLSRLASALGAPASALNNVGLPIHDHILTTRNGDQPEWWNVIVIPVSTPQGLASVEKAKDYNAVKALEGQSGTGIGGEIPTNAYLWFQTLPGNGPATPGPVQTSCTSKLPAGKVVGAAPLADGTGYIETDSAGDVSVFGAATCYGSLSGVKLSAPIVGIAVDRVTNGYWLVASDGGVFAFNAPFQGSAGGVKLNAPIVGIAANQFGDGYYLVASDGGVFAYNAPFEGSAGAIKLAKPIVGMAVDPLTDGYWLVASDGGVFAYNTDFYGSAGGIQLSKPIVGIAPLEDGSGYRLIASDGGVFDYNADFYGSTGGITLASPVIGGMNNNSYDGYWLVGSDGGIFTFSPPGVGMPFYGSAAS